MVKKQDLENKEIKEDANLKELELLRARVATLEAEKRVPAVNPFNEIQQMRVRGQDDAGAIKYKDIHDHRNIRLWHTNGREVGR